MVKTHDKNTGKNGAHTNARRAENAAIVKALPDLLQKYKPVEVTDSGKWVYEIAGENGKTRKIVTALKEIKGKLRRILISDYWVDAPKYPIRELLK